MLLMQCGVTSDAFTYDEQFDIYKYTPGSVAVTGSATLSNN